MTANNATMVLSIIAGGVFSLQAAAPLLNLLVPLAMFDTMLK
jgi:hypothetical protein